jgi:hypothetical protein
MEGSQNFRYHMLPTGPTGPQLNGHPMYGCQIGNQLLF